MGSEIHKIGVATRASLERRNKAEKKVYEAAEAAQKAAEAARTRDLNDLRTASRLAVLPRQVLEVTEQKSICLASL